MSRGIDFAVNDSLISPVISHLYQLLSLPLLLPSSQKGLFACFVWLVGCCFHFHINASSFYYYGCKVNLPPHPSLVFVLEGTLLSVCSVAEIPYPFLLSYILPHQRTHPERRAPFLLAPRDRDAPAHS